jgi:hypothetical protein
MPEQTIGYKRAFKIRILVPGKRHAVAGIPYEVLEREATLRNLTVDEFIKRFKVVAEYDNFEGIHQTFQEIKEDENGK